MADFFSADLHGELEWERFDIPGGSMPVSLCRLYVDPATRAMTAAVRFPVGWERTEVGSYEAAEEFLVLEGSIEMNGQNHEPGTWVRVAAGAVRHGTSTPDGALAVARFDGPARWNPRSSQ